VLSLVRQSSNYKHRDHSETVDDGDDDDNNSDDDDAYDGDDIRQTGSVKEIHTQCILKYKQHLHTSIHACLYIYT